MVIEDIRYLIKPIIENTELCNHVFFVGGCVRDFCINKEPKDIDLVVDVKNGSLKLANLLKLHFHNNITAPYNLGHYPIYSVTFKNDIELNNKIYHVKNISIEIAETMKESFVNKRSRQRNVEFSTIVDDVLRRDFSMNSGLISVTDFSFIDITKHIKSDIQNKIICCNIGVDKDKIFSEDPLRILRGCVFHARLNWNIEEETAKAMTKNGYRLKIVSRERITSEIKKAFNVKYGVYRLVNILNRLDLLKYVFPNLEESKNVLQWIDKNTTDSRNVHLEGYSVFHHIMNVLRHTEVGEVNAFASLFHDVGKTNDNRTVTDDGKVRFIDHEIIGKKIAENVLKTFYKLDNKTIDLISFLIENHMSIYKLDHASDKSIRKFIIETKNEEIRKLLFNLCNADSLGTIVKYEDGSIGNNLSYVEIQDRIEEFINNEKNNVEIIPLFNGIELMNILNIENPCALVGKTKKLLLDIQCEYNSDDKEFVKQELIKRFNN